MTYFSWAALSSCTTRSYFLLVFSTLFLTRVALPVLGTDSMKASHSWIFLVFSGSIRRTSLVMFCRKTKPLKQLSMDLLATEEPHLAVQGEEGSQDL